MGALKNIVTGAAALLGIEPAAQTEQAPDVHVEADPDVARIERIRRVEEQARAIAGKYNADLQTVREDLARAEERFASATPDQADEWIAARNDRDRLVALVALREPDAQNSAVVLQQATEQREAYEREAYVKQQTELGAIDRLDRAVASDIADIIEHEQALESARARLQDHVARTNQHRANAGVESVNPGRVSALLIVERAAGNITEAIALEVRTALGAYNCPALRIPIEPAEYVRRVMSCDRPNPCAVVDDEIATAAREAAKSPVERQVEAERAANTLRHNAEVSATMERLARHDAGQPSLADRRVDTSEMGMLDIDQIAGSVPHRKVQLPSGAHGFVPGNYQVKTSTPG